MKVKTVNFLPPSPLKYDRKPTKKMKIFRNFHISYMNNTNEIDMKKNNYLSKNINFLTPRPPKYNINLLKKTNFF